MVRIATLNLCALPPVLSRLAPFAVRAAEIGRTVEASDVDLLNVQELWGRRSAAALRRHLPSFPHVAWERSSSGGPAGGVATFSRLPLGPPRYRSFAGTAPRTSTRAFRTWRALNARRQGVLVVPIRNTTVLVANAHLTANKDGDWSAENRYSDFHRDQLAVVHAFVRAARTDTTELTILTGDFNIASDSPLYPFVTDGDAWRDPFRETTFATYRAEFLPPTARVHRIDYVLLAGDATRFPASGAEPMFADAFAGPGGAPTWPSDHIGLTVRVDVPAR